MLLLTGVNQKPEGFFEGCPKVLGGFEPEFLFEKLIIVEVTYRKCFIIIKRNVAGS